MQTLSLDRNKRALAIVAHPDDETIFMGGTIMKNPQVRWTIFSLCRASDSDRAPKFKKVCARFKAKSIITDLDDENKLSVKQTLPVIKKLIIENLAGQRFDYIFTHGGNGEYGHPRHIGVHKMVVQLIKQKILKPKAVFYFNYVKKLATTNGDHSNKNNRSKTFVTKADTNCILKLSPTELKMKREIVAYQYGYDINGIDVNYCTNPEAFIKKEIK